MIQTRGSGPIGTLLPATRTVSGNGLCGRLVELLLQLLQSPLGRRWRKAGRKELAAGVFGLAHLPDLRYVLLATLAGIGYGWVYARTGKITASALTHTGVNWIWGLFLSYP